MNLTKLVSQFMDIYTNLYWFYNFVLETKLENILEKERGPVSSTSAWRPNSPARLSPANSVCSLLQQAPPIDGRCVSTFCDMRKSSLSISKILVVSLLCRSYRPREGFKLPPNKKPSCSWKICLHTSSLYTLSA